MKKTSLGDRTVLIAEEGMILTNGSDFGKQIHVAHGSDESVWHEITEEEYKQYMIKMEEEIRIKNEEIY